MTLRTHFRSTGTIVAAVLLIFAALASPAAMAGDTASLPNPTVDTKLAATDSSQTLVLAGGCFWGIQGVFQHMKGVTQATAGYSGGAADTAQYETVSTGRTGHAESVQITYDPAQVTVGQILKVFFSVALDPTELNRQGPDSGTQYRSAIFFANPEQQHVAQAYVAQLDAAKVFPKPIVTQVVPLTGFYPAEAYHQNYLLRHPDSLYIVINDLPKVANFKRELPGFYVATPASAGPATAS